MEGTEYCPECGSKSLDRTMENVGIICESCGALIDSPSSSPPRKNGAGKDTNSRKIDATWENFSAIHNGTQANVVEGLDILNSLADRFSFNDTVRSRAADLFAGVMKQNGADGRDLSLTVAAVLFLACRLENQPRPLAGFADNTDYSKTQIDSVSRKIQSLLDLDQPLTEPSQYLQWLLKSLELETQKVDEAREILQRIPSMKVNGKHPAGVAGASVYLVAEDNVTQREIARMCGVTKETIRVNLKLLRGEIDV